MISLYREQFCLLELIKASLFGITPEIPNNVNWNEVIKLAKVQCILPLILSFLPEDKKSELFSISCQSKAHYMQMLYEQDSLVRLLNSSSIPFVIFKGTAAAIYYPIPSMRTFGDIDFYVSEEYFDSAKNVLEHNGYLYIEHNYRHYEYEKNGIVFELHSKISSDRYNDIEHIVINGFLNTTEYKLGNSSFPGFQTYENGIILLGHIMQHLKGSGIGFRQILDWMMFVHRELNDSAWFEHFQPLVAEAGLEKLAVTVTLMCKKWLGLPDEIMWFKTADENVADQLLIRILDDGNFGNDRSSSEGIKKSLKKEGAFKYFQRVGANNWPLARKYVIFRPFAWLYQICRFIFKGIAGLFSGKKIFMKNKKNMSLEEIWQSLE